MDLHLSTEKLFIGVIYSTFLTGLVCGSGYWMARLLPVRFNGEKVLIGLLTGSLVAFLTYGAEKLLDNQMQPFRIITIVAWFLLQGIAGEVTVQLAARCERNAGR